MKKAIKDYLAKLQDNKKDKGFSLVELIIVIAIMAILVGVVASQVLPYIEKSRKAKDLEALNNVSTDMITAITDAMADGKQLDATKTGSASENITVTDSAAPSGASSDLLKLALQKYDEAKGQSTTDGSELKKVAAKLNAEKSAKQFVISFDHKNKVLAITGGGTAVTIAADGTVSGGEPGLIIESSLQ